MKTKLAFLVAMVFALQFLPGLAHAESLQCTLSNVVIVIQLQSSDKIDQVEIFANRFIGSGRMGRHLQFYEKVFGLAAIQTRAEGTHMVAEGEGFQFIYKRSATKEEGFSGYLMAPTEISGVQLGSEYAYYCKSRD